MNADSVLQRLRWCSTGVAVAIAMFLFQSVMAQTRLPGEVIIPSHGRLIGVSSVPTVTEILETVENPSVMTVLTGLFMGEPGHLFGPRWSNSSDVVACLRCDLSEGTRKVVLRGLHRPSFRHWISVPLEGTGSFENIPIWRDGGQPFLLFTSSDARKRRKQIGPATQIYEQAVLRDSTDVLASEDRFLDHLHAVSAGAAKRLVYRAGQELILASLIDGELQRESLGEGIEARLSPRGDIVAMVREARDGGEYRLLARHILTGKEKQLDRRQTTIRNPRYSHDGRLLAYFARSNAQAWWDLFVVALAGHGAPRLLSQQVHVSDALHHLGPAWSRHSRVVWTFAVSGSTAHRTLQFTDLATQESTQVPLPEELTTPASPAVHPHPNIPMVAFAGHTGESRDIFVAVLNRMP